MPKTVGNKLLNYIRPILHSMELMQWMELCRLYSIEPTLSSKYHKTVPMVYHAASTVTQMITQYSTIYSSEINYNLLSKYLLWYLPDFLYPLILIVEC